MERLTFDDNGCNSIKACENDLCRETCVKVDGCLDCPIKRAIDKLAEYEDMEEKGKLVKLPCAVGDTMYVIAECENISPQLDGTLYSEDGSPGTATGYYCPYEDNCPHDCEEFTSCDDYKKKKTIFEDAVSQITIDESGVMAYTENCGVCEYVGEYHIFTEREQAEQALQAMKQEQT